MPIEKNALGVLVEGTIFEVKAFWTRSNPPQPSQSFTLLVHNRSGKWVDVVVDRSLGTASTGHIPDGQDGGFSEAVSLYLGGAAGDPIKITRWRPGFLEIPGNGGGEIKFVWPTPGDPHQAESILIELTVTG